MAYKNGISRKKTKKGFFYFYINNKKPVSERVLKRIYKLRIPPAWEDVWIATNTKESIQVTGFDSKGRKQYRYNEMHIQEAEKQKFIRLYDFILAIPKLERRMRYDRKTKHIYSKERVIATMLRIVKKVHMRVGKEIYAKRNKSYGLSSLKKVHAKLTKDKLTFNFKGKSNKRLFYTLRDPLIIEHVKLLMKLNGEKLFQYIDESVNSVKRVTDIDLNYYIQRFMGDKFTIKDFRTYAANNYFIESLLKETSKNYPESDKDYKKNIRNAIKRTAYYLKHTKAISKKSYIMDFVKNKYESDADYFINRIDDNPTKVLVDLLKLYKKKVLNI